MKWFLVPLLFIVASCSDGPPSTGHDVVLIVVDTLRGDHVHGENRPVATPRLDELAREGIAFPLAFSHTSWTLPSHTALFSSRYPRDTGVLLNGQVVPEDLPLLAEWMRSHGYRTEAVVSLCSLIPTGEVNRLDRGFDHFDDRMRRVLNPADLALEHMRASLDRLEGSEEPFFLFAHYADPHAPYRAHGTSELPADVLLNGEAVGGVDNLAGFAPFEATLTLAPGENRLVVRSSTPFTVKYVSVDGPSGRLPVEFDDIHLVQESEVLIDNAATQPVDVAVELWAWDTPEPDEARRRYALEVGFLDGYVGGLIDELKRRGLYEDTLIVLTADHGEGLGEHGLLDHGLNLFDELLHVPLIIKPPAGHEAWELLRARADRIASHVDLAPTILNVLELPALPGQVGTSLLEPGDGVHFAEAHALAIDDYFALRDERWKMLYAPATDRFVLFDVQADPRESRNLFKEHGDELQAWQARLRELAEGAPDAADIDRDLDPETMARMRAMGYF